MEDLPEDRKGNGAAAADEPQEGGAEGPQIPLPPYLQEPAALQQRSACGERAQEACEFRLRQRGIFDPPLDQNLRAEM